MNSESKEFLGTYLIWGDVAKPCSETAMFRNNHVTDVLVISKSSSHTTNIGVVILFKSGILIYVIITEY